MPAVWLAYVPVETAVRLRTGQPLLLDSATRVLLWWAQMAAIFQRDALLLRRVIRGDIPSWQKFIVTYSPFIFSAVVRFADDDDEKMNMYLFVLERLRENGFAKLRQFRFRASLSTWLTAVARNLAIDFLRGRYGRDFRLKRFREVSYDDDSEAARQLVDPHNPESRLREREDETRRQELAGLLRPALSKLSDQEALLVQLVFFKGFKIGEAGKLAGVGSVYKFMERTLRKIRCELQAASELEPEQWRELLQGEGEWTGT